jgi:hypothetical protein
MKKKNRNTFSKYLFFCALLIITSVQLAAHTFSGSSHYNSIQLLQVLNSEQRNGCPVIERSHETDHRHYLVGSYEAVNEVEEKEDSGCSRKAGNEHIPKWDKVSCIISQLVSANIREPLQRGHFFYNTSDNRYLILQVFRI